MKNPSKPQIQPQSLIIARGLYGNMSSCNYVHALDNKVTEAYCHLYQKLRDEGASIPDADLLIAATAISAETTLESRDEHFERLKPLGLTLKPHP
jgi:hypothetical protein